MHFSCGSGVVILTETRIRKEFDSEKGTNPNALTGRLYGLNNISIFFEALRNGLNSKILRIL